MEIQLPLGVLLRDDATLESYYGGQNAQALASIGAVARGLGEQYLYLWGEPGVGCTHLLQGACHEAYAQGRAAFYVPMAVEVHQSPQILEGLESLDLVCLDDIQAIAGCPAWEESVFHLFNRIREIGHTNLVIAGQAPPTLLGLGLPDLRSRLGWGVVYRLHPLQENEMLEALKVRAHARGLVLTEEVSQYLMRHYARSMPALYRLLDRLDQASLAAQRKLTIPFIKHVLSTVTRV